MLPLSLIYNNELLIAKLVHFLETTLRALKTQTNDRKSSKSLKDRLQSFCPNNIFNNHAYIILYIKIYRVNKVKKSFPEV